MRAVVTGATGFLGSRIVQHLVKDGVDVVCLVRSSSNLLEIKYKLTKQQWERITIVPCRLEATESYQEYLDSTTIVYHVAAALNGNTSTLFLNTVVPTRKLVNAAIAKQVQRFVLVSSMGIYGPQSLPSGTTITEDSPLDEYPHKRDSYTFTKAVQEKLCRDAYREKGLRLVVIRPGVIFGPGRGLLSGRVGLKMGNMLIRMGGYQQLPYTYVDNCALAVISAGITPGIEGQIYNIVDDDLPRGREVVRICKQHGEKIRQVIIPRVFIHSLCGIYEKYSQWTKGQLPPVLTRHRSQAMWRTLKYSNAKAKKELNWSPVVPMSEALHLTASTPEIKQS